MPLVGHQFSLRAGLLNKGGVERLDQRKVPNQKLKRKSQPRQDLLAAFDTVLAGKDGPEADLRGLSSKIGMLCRLR